MNYFQNMSLVFTLLKNQDKINESSVSIDLGDFVNYRITLYEFQKEINCYLTTLIEQNCPG